MNCAEVQQRLSDYLERSLDTESANTVQSHLSSCSRCRVEADGLAESIRRVVSLPSVDPPVDFTDRVMARVREPTREPNFWERLFLPVRIKIPIHATALVMIALSALYLYQRDRPHEKESATYGQDFYREDKNEEPRSPRLADQPSASKPKKAKVADELATQGSRRAEQSSESASRSLGLSKEQASSKISELTADYELVVRLRVALKRDETVKDKLTALLDQAEGQSAPRGAEQEITDRALPLAARRTEPGTLWLTIPRNQFDRFKKDLAALVKIESESQLPAGEKEALSKSDDRLRIKLTILAPADLETASPSDEPSK